MPAFAATKFTALIATFATAAAEAMLRLNKATTKIWGVPTTQVASDWKHAVAQRLHILDNTLGRDDNLIALVLGEPTDGFNISVEDVEKR